MYQVNIIVFYLYIKFYFRQTNLGNLRYLSSQALIKKLPVDKDSSYGFFQLIASRYKKKPTILTTNQPFSKQPDIFGDSVIANAIIDRLVHHCDIAKITGQSYRIKGRRIFDDQDE